MSECELKPTSMGAYCKVHNTRCAESLRVVVDDLRTKLSAAEGRAVEWKNHAGILQDSVIQRDKTNAALKRRAEAAEQDWQTTEKSLTEAQAHIAKLVGGLRVSNDATKSGLCREKELKFHMAVLLGALESVCKFLPLGPKGSELIPARAQDIAKKAIATVPADSMAKMKREWVAEGMGWAVGILKLLASGDCPSMVVRGAHLKAAERVEGESKRLIRTTQSPEGEQPKKLCYFCQGEGRAWVWSKKRGNHWSHCVNCLAKKNEGEHPAKGGA